MDDEVTFGGDDLDAPKAAGDHPPVPLEYFQARPPDERRSRAVTICALLLLGSWLPYLCGVVNASTLAILYTRSIITAHENGAILFMGLGLMTSAIGLIGFVRLRHAVGIWSAALVMAVQVVIAVCAGLAL